MITALLPPSVSLARHPDAWPYTHRWNGAGESIGTLHASNTGPEPQVSLPLAACAQGLLPSVSDIYHFFSRVSCRISIPSILSASILFSRTFSFKELFHPLGLVDINHSKLTLPAGEGLFADVVLPAHFLDRFTPVCLPQYPYLLFGGVFFCLSLSESFLGYPD